MFHHDQLPQAGTDTTWLGIWNSNSEQWMHYVLHTVHRALVLCHFFTGLWYSATSFVSWPHFTTDKYKLSPLVHHSISLLVYLESSKLLLTLLGLGIPKTKSQCMKYVTYLVCLYSNICNGLGKEWYTFKKHDLIWCVQIIQLYNCHLVYHRQYATSSCARSSAFL